MIRRVFTVVATVAFGLVLAMPFYSDDSRFTMWRVGVILHRHNRMAVRLPRGSVWEFNYMLAYVPAVACFLGAIAWNAVVLHRKRTQRSSVGNEPGRDGPIAQRPRSQSDWIFRCLYIFFVLVLILLIVFALTWHK